MTIILFVLALSTVATSATVETLHHSFIGGLLWRSWAILFHHTPGLTLFGKGMRCPYCYGVWFGILYAGVLLRLFYQTDVVTFVILTFVTGISAARIAQLFNDAMKQFVYIRTPNENRHSSGWQMRRQSMSDAEIQADDAATTVEERVLKFIGYEGEMQ